MSLLMEYHPVRSPSSSSSGYQAMNSPFGDTTYTKVFVGGLAWETQNDTLRQHFEPFGDILEAVVIVDKSTGRSKGYGFVTFREPEAAGKACVDPTPVIDGRRANCNLACLGRTRPPAAPGRPRSSASYVGISQPRARGTLAGNYGYQQPVYYSYHQGYGYPTYGYSSYGQEYVYPQGVYSPHMSQQYVQMYGMQNVFNNSTGVYSYAPVGHNIPRGNNSYTAVTGYSLAGHPVMQFGGPSIDAMTVSLMPPAVPPSYPSGLASGESEQEDCFEWQACTNLAFQNLHFCIHTRSSAIIVLRAAGRCAVLIESLPERARSQRNKLGCCSASLRTPSGPPNDCSRGAGGLELVDNRERFHCIGISRAYSLTWSIMKFSVIRTSNGLRLKS
ncbi:hypothetical protein MLD38_000844 [Melastoma candidum]|uniref:Uncharacterized protein n=1 Tax=Melastoma candidum TaxID=119954 RepID=A0ACB9SBS9_9MYRT|nr:hypothetical protein MLD38_000844 [Melastoma candidum]